MTSHYPCYDGNGNLRKLLHATTLATTATYDYAPFGELTRATGPYALTNSYRFSTKPQDKDTGLLYYNYRHYDAKVRRWLSRDPIGEEDGVNLYGFVGNVGLNNFDGLGLAPPNSAAKSISKLANLEALFKSLCEKCHCEQKPKAKKECEVEATRLAANVRSVWLANYGRGNNAGPSNCSGYLFYEWTETWVIAARRFSLNRWTFIGHGREQSQESAGQYIPYIHFWSEFRAYGSNEAKYTI